MTDISELAARCEAATGPDRELDALIWCALNGKRFKGSWHNDFLGCTQAEFTEPPKRTAYVTKSGDVLPWTASLDAALSLVPEGWVFSVDTLDGRPEAVVGNDKRAIVQADYRGAATPALALCAAALRARSKTQAEGR